MGHIEDRNIKRLAAMFSQARINSADNTDEQALEVQSLYPNWEELAEGTELKTGSRVNYKDVLYNVLMTHKKQKMWTPEDAPSLFAKVLIPEPSVIPEWEQPTSTNGYMTGDKVTHKEKTWESLVDNNVWEPGAVGTESLWKEV